MINYDMPGQLAQYLHRVGRTARAGKKGRYVHYELSLWTRSVLALIQLRSVTLVGETDRKVLKAAIKHSAGEDQVRHRVVPPDTVAKFKEKLEGLKGEIAEVMKEELEEKQVRGSDVSSAP